MAASRTACYSRPVHAVRGWLPGNGKGRRFSRFARIWGQILTNGTVSVPPSSISISCAIFWRIDWWEFRDSGVSYKRDRGLLWSRLLLWVLVHDCGTITHTGTCTCMTIPGVDMATTALDAPTRSGVNWDYDITYSHRAYKWCGYQW